jgi:hypothetical protein
MFTLAFIIEGKPALAQEFLSSEPDPVASGNCLHSPESRVADPDPHASACIRIQLGSWIRIRLRNVGLDPATCSLCHLVENGSGPFRSLWRLLSPLAADISGFFLTVAAE